MSEFIEIPANANSLSHRQPLYGVGINDAEYMVKPIINGKRSRCPYYQVWMSMLTRCYCEKYQQKRPTYTKCLVIKEWLVFSVFKKWMKAQNWQGMDLDKDIKIIGNDIYSPETCVFVSRQVNSLLNDCGSARGEWPIGVIFCKRSKKFLSSCCKNGKNKHIGYFSNPEEASAAYKKYKYKVILETANKPENTYIRQYLINHANMLL